MATLTEEQSLAMSMGALQRKNIEEAQVLSTPFIPKMMENKFVTHLFAQLFNDNLFLQSL